MLTTGQIAVGTALSEKAIRMYADRGLLRSHRDGANHRVFLEDQIDRARRIALLRMLDFSLADVGAVLDAPDPAAAFDLVWETRRGDVARRDRASEYVRRALTAAPVLPEGLKVRPRSVLGRSVLRITGEAALPAMASVLAELSGRLFSALTNADAPLAGPIYAEFCSRATEKFAGQIRLCAPFGGAIHPPADMDITFDPAHDELSVGLDQASADDQRLVVAVHDYLSAQYEQLRAGPDREIYHPEFGTGANGHVMEIALPIRAGWRVRSEPGSPVRRPADEIPGDALRGCGIRRILMHEDAPGAR
ncbi:MerR family transcriptional regulator [Microbacterium aurum]